MKSKQNLFLAILIIVCVIGAAVPVMAQDVDWPGADSSSSDWPGTEKKADKPAPAPAAESSSSTETAKETPKTASPAPAKTSGGGGGGGGLLAVIIGYISQIGALFGKATGFRIGGTTGTGIITLVVAQALKDKAPDWVRYVLLAGGGTMFAGSGANILQMLM